MIKLLLKIWWILWVLVITIPCFLIALLIWLLISLFDRRRIVLQKFTCMWASLYTFIAPNWRVKVLGKNQIDKKRVYVIISNHQSMLDIPVAFRLHMHFKFISKEEIFKIPFIGWNMVLNRYISLKRGDKNSTISMMQEAEQHISEGSSVYMFPEGTRSSDGSLKPLKNGAFILARKMKVPVLPVVIHGTAKALPKNTLEFQGKHTMIVKVLKPISYDYIKGRTDSEVAKFVHTRMKQELEALARNE